MPSDDLPTAGAAAYRCPHCNVYSNQTWASLRLDGSGAQPSYIYDDRTDFLQRAQCAHCKKYNFWYLGHMIYPEILLVPLPSPDLSEDIKADYLEAARIIHASPRGAAALLRLCLQKLFKHLGEMGKGPKGKNINEDIKILVKNGLPPRTQQALDAVRVIGNEAVHPGEMDLRDDTETAYKLFSLVNFITQEMITRDKELDELYGQLPEQKLKEIQKRDNPQQS